MAEALIVPLPSGTKSTERAQEPIFFPQFSQEPRLGSLPVVGMELAAPYSALPDEVLFGAFRHPALKLRKPILLQTERSETGIAVFWEETEEFGSGETFSSAIDDFGVTLAELYLRLEECDSLSDYLQGVRNKLADYIEVRPQ
jgi:hypothetical protein